MRAVDRTGTSHGRATGRTELSKKKLITRYRRPTSLFGTNEQFCPRTSTSDAFSFFTILLSTIFYSHFFWSSPAQLAGTAHCGKILHVFISSLFPHSSHFKVCQLLNLFSWFVAHFLALPYFDWIMSSLSSLAQCHCTGDPGNMLI